MKAIVFGGSGFVGSHVADSLFMQGDDVVIFDNSPSEFLQDGQIMVVGDILDREAVDKAVAGCDVVFHFAGLADLDDARTKPLDTVRLNILGSINILESCVRHEIKRFVYASSLYVYSDKGGFYRCSKQAVETYIEEFKRQYGLEYTILRYGTLYGPRSDDRNAVYRYIHDVLTKKKLVLDSSGDERREYIYVKDAASLTLDILVQEYANTSVTLTGHQSILFKELIFMITEMLESDLEVEFAGRKGTAHYAYTPYSYTPKAGLKLTLNPFTDLGQGLLECMEEVDNKITGIKG